MGVQAANSICCIFNYAPHYNLSTYRLMSKELPCVFFFGNKGNFQIKKLDYSFLETESNELPFWHIGSFYGLWGSPLLCFNSKYKIFILTGEPYWLSSWLILLINKILRKKTLLWTHGFYGDEKPIKLAIKKTYFQLANHILTYGNRSRELMILAGIKSSKIDVIYNALDFETQDNLFRKLINSNRYASYFRNHHPNVLFIGRLTQEKKLHLLIKAQHHLKTKSNFFVNLIIIGAGQQKQELINLSEKLGLSSSIWFYGPCYQETKLSELIFDADLCVSPGNVGLTAIHSLSYGTPVITHRNFNNQGPEFEAIEEGVNGAFFEENNWESLAITIQKWLSRYPDKTINLIEECRNVISQKYNPSYQLRILKKILS